MTATAYVYGIKAMKMLLPLQADQLIQLAPHMSEKQRKDTFTAVKAEHDSIVRNVKEAEDIQDRVEKETKQLYKKEWPKLKDAIQEEERAGAAAKLDEQIDAA